MSNVSSTTRVITSLRVGERVLAWCDDGLLNAEYALFNEGDTVLHAADPVTVRETGYMTTAGEALARLARSGLTRALAEQAANALRPEVRTSYARTLAVREVAARLGAQELFDGAIYRARFQCYEGIWLDLRALVSKLPPGSALVLQALHLAVALTEVPASSPLHLTTETAADDRRPSERTFQRVSLDAARQMPSMLRRLAPRPVSAEADPDREERICQALLARVRERMVDAERQPQLLAHLTKLEASFVREGSTNDPLADPELRAIDRLLDRGDFIVVHARLDRFENAHGRTYGVRYLRAKLALARGNEPPVRVAQAFTELAHGDGRIAGASLGAARAWLAAGDDARARHFARRTADDPSSRDSERIVALEILSVAPPTSQSQAPAEVVPDTVPIPRMLPPRPALFPSLGDVPPPVTIPPTMPPPPVAPSAPAIPVAAIPVAAWSGGSGGFRGRYNPELVETLALPLGATEDVLGPNDLPRTPRQARVAMTRLARDLARDYRLWYGKALRCDVMAIEAMQQHLMRRFTGVSISDPQVAWELRRHGALLSETLARALGADWEDVSPSEPGYWTMHVPPTIRSWPIGRIYRFVSLGQQVRDLVSYYLDLEERARMAYEG